jgi:excisionase family DNA binding protein
MNIKQAAEYLNISVKTLERKIAAGDVSVAYVPGATGKQRTFDAAELDRFKASESEKAAATTYVISKSRNSDAPSLNALQRGGNEQGIAMLVSMLADAVHAQGTRGNDTGGQVSITDLSAKLTLTIDDAARLSGLSANHIREAIKTGKLKARIIGRGWKIAPDILKTYVTKILNNR